MNRYVVACDHLTPRELEIEKLIVLEHLTNVQIAERLVISIETVKTHVSNILTKRGVASRKELSAWA